MNLSSRITLEQFKKSDVGTRAHIEEQFNPPQNIIEPAKALCENVIEKLFNLFPDLHINSGYRCPKVNALIGGSATSQHCKGEAVDVSIKSLSNIKIAQAVLFAKIPFDQMIIEGGTMEKPVWIHLSYSKFANRAQILRADFSTGKAVYTGLTPKQIQEVK